MEKVVKHFHIMKEIFKMLSPPHRKNDAAAPQEFLVKEGR